MLLCVTLCDITYAQAQPNAQETKVKSHETTPLLEIMKNQAESLTITVFPVFAPAVNSSKARAEFARAMALVLERSGVKKIEISEEEFEPERESPAYVDEITKGFVEFLKENPVNTDYAYFTAFYGRQATGASDIITIVLDHDGNMVWVDKQTRQDKEFRRFNPRDPFSCCFVSIEKLRKKIGLKDPLDRGAYSGEWSKYWEKQRNMKFEEFLEQSIRSSIENIEQMVYSDEFLEQPVSKTPLAKQKREALDRFSTNHETISSTKDLVPYKKKEPNPIDLSHSDNGLANNFALYLSGACLFVVISFIAAIKFRSNVKKVGGKILNK